MFRSSLCDSSDAYILAKGITTAAALNNKKVIFKNCILFTNCISSVNITLIDDAHDMDAVMPVHNLIEYSDNYSNT